jgi:hypothetical protein
MTGEQVVQQVIELREIEGQMQKTIANMGDAAAVAVTRTLAGTNPSPDDMNMVLVILTTSFGDPNGVKVVSDRQPRTALLVLQYLDLCAKSSDLKKRIADTRIYIQGQYAKYLQQSSPK